MCGQRGQGRAKSLKLYDSERNTRKRESQYKPPFPQCPVPSLLFLSLSLLSPLRHVYIWRRRKQRDNKSGFIRKWLLRASPSTDPTPFAVAMETCHERQCFSKCTESQREKEGEKTCRCGPVGGGQFEKSQSRQGRTPQSLSRCKFYLSTWLVTMMFVFTCRFVFTFTPFLSLCYFVPNPSCCPDSVSAWLRWNGPSSRLQ